MLGTFHYCARIFVCCLHFQGYSHSVLSLVPGYFYDITMMCLGVNFYLLNHYYPSWDFFSCGNDVAFLKTDLMSILWKYIMN